MTLEALEVDLANCFEPGHAYVALSRATSLGGAKLLSFDAARVFAHPDVLRFYASLDASASAAVPSADLMAGGGGAAVACAASGAARRPTSGLTEEQRRRIEEKRAAALARRDGGTVAATTGTTSAGAFGPAASAANGCDGS